MTTAKGGPAYPFEYHNQTSGYQEGFFDTGKLAPGASQQFAGMTLRDYFAAKALSGMLADPTFEQGCEKAAQTAYLFAEAMLQERLK